MFDIDEPQNLFHTKLQEAHTQNAETQETFKHDSKFGISKRSSNDRYLHICF